MYPISFSSHYFPFQNYKEERLLKGKFPSYHHIVIPLSLGLVLERCLLVVGGGRDFSNPDQEGSAPQSENKA